jgi:hypothetical protein
MFLMFPLCISCWKGYNISMKKIIILFLILAFFPLANISFAADPSNTPDVGSCTANGGVYAIAVAGDGTVYVGGSFTTFCGQPRSALAAIDSNGNLLPWDPNVNIGGYINVGAMAVSGSTVYVGGVFTSVGGQSRNNLAALDATTGLATSWDPNPNSSDFGTTALTVDGSNVYVSGDFTTIGGQSRNNIAAIDSTTGLATIWNPNANNVSYSIVVSGSTVYTDGEFNNIGGQSRNHIAALDATTGLATSWNPGSSASISFLRAIAVSGSTVYVGGFMNSIGGQTRRGIAALDATTGLATSWNPNAGSGKVIFGLAVSGSTVYTVGNFTSIGGQSRNRIAALATSNGVSTPWNPNANGSNTTAIVATSSKVYVGGDFTTIGGASQQSFATFSIPSNSTPTTTSISPTTKTVGDSQFTLTVNGTNFVTDSVVKWNGTSLTTTYVSSTQLTATVPTLNLATGGTVDVTVFNPTPGGGTSNAQTFNINNPVPTLTSISPTTTTMNSPQFTLTTTGTNFVSDSVIKWNDTSLTTTYVSATELTATVPSTNILSPGTANITVTNSTPGGGTTDPITFTIKSSYNSGGGSYVPQQPKTTTQIPQTTTTITPTPTPITTIPTCTITKTLRQGNKGEEVKCLQNKLNITQDGLFGKLTKQSVITFQKNHNLTPDGVVGKRTRGEVNK